MTRLIYDSSGSPLTLERVPCLDEKVVSIAAGAEHSALVTGETNNTWLPLSFFCLMQLKLFTMVYLSEKGSVMTWGWGEHGQLGLGDTSDQTRPQKVKLDCNGSFLWTQFAVYCGSGFTIVAKATE